MSTDGQKPACNRGTEHHEMSKTAEQIELAYATLDHIEAHPEEWDQKNWHCGTSFCFGGRAVQLSGIGVIGDAANADQLVFLRQQPDGTHDYASGVGLSTAAREVLGLHYGGEAFELFRASNTLPYLRELVAIIFGPRPEKAGDEATHRAGLNALKATLNRQDADRAAQTESAFYARQHLL